MNALWFSSMMLAIESQGVVALRLVKIAEGGPASQAERVLMVEEKVMALFEAGMMLMAGRTPTRVVERYREQVAANSDRLLAR